MNLIIKAKEFARTAHAGQSRKYTGEAYIVHPFRVAAEVLKLPEATEDMVCAAYLHDVIEDTPVTDLQIMMEFNNQIAEYVVGLTSYSKQIDSKEHRWKRKEMDREYLAKQSNEVKIIKMIDRTDNLRDLRISEDNVDFISKYIDESKDLYEVIHNAHLNLGHKLFVEMGLLRINIKRWREEQKWLKRQSPSHFTTD
jgi:guanosine-3',5'-bis(diphosphate) 3'-pyrophosphohydrolase